MAFRIKELHGPSHAIEHLLFPSELEVIYIAIDFEYASNILDKFRISRVGIPSPLHSQLGLSIWDPRKLRQSALSSLPSLPTHNYITGPEAYFEKSAKEFTFGTSKWIPACPKAISEEIHKHIPRNRNIVLVFHGAHSDLRVLESIGADLNTSIIGFLDTNHLARALGMKWVQLKHLLCDLGYTHGGQNFRNAKSNAGDNANFMLRTLMLLGLKSYEERRCIYDSKLFLQLSSWRMDFLKAMALGKGIYSEAEMPLKVENLKKDIASKTSEQKLEPGNQLELPIVTKVQKPTDDDWELVHESEPVDDEWNLVDVEDGPIHTEEE